MAFARNYLCDTFLSYAHVDDAPLPGSSDDKGWVSYFYETLKIEVCKRLGQTDIVLWKDDDLAYHRSLSDQLMNNVRRSAILIVMLSPGYVNSAWCARERAAFMEVLRQRSDAPILVVAKEWMADSQVPAELRDYKRFLFYSGTESNSTTFGYPKPSPDNPKHTPFYDKVYELSREIASALTALAAPGLSEPSPAQPPGKVVFLAETEDLEEERDTVRAFLDRHGVRVLPEAGVYYPPGGEEFRQKVSADIAAADAFVQLLSGRRGKRPADVPEGYPRLQWELADALAGDRQRAVLHWCSPALDVSKITDPHVSFLLGLKTVRQESLADFEKAILAELAKPVASASAAEKRSFVCVNVDEGDRPLAEQIEASLQRLRTEYVSIFFGGSVPANRELLENGLRDCDGLIVVYGQAKDTWVDRHLYECRKSIAYRERPFGALGVFLGPPPDPPDKKPRINVYLDGLESYDCRASVGEPEVVEQRVRAFLDRLRPRAA